MAAKRNTRTKGKAAHGSKTAFVLAQPSDMPAKEVAAKAKQQGLSFSASYVYKVRGRATPAGPMRNHGASKPRGDAATRTGAMPVGSPTTALKLSSDDPHERAILNAVSAIGLARARAVLAAVDALFTPGLVVEQAMAPAAASARESSTRSQPMKRKRPRAAKTKPPTRKAEPTTPKAKPMRKVRSSPSAARDEALAGARAAFLAAEVERQNEAFRAVNGSSGASEPAPAAAESLTIATN